MDDALATTVCDSPCMTYWLPKKVRYRTHMCVRRRRTLYTMFRLLFVILFWWRNPFIQSRNSYEVCTYKNMIVMLFLASIVLMKDYSFHTQSYKITSKYYFNIYPGLGFNSRLYTTLLKIIFCKFMFLKLLI